MSNINAITTDSDEFARQAMAYLESRGFKVTKEKLNLPMYTHSYNILSLLTCSKDHAHEIRDTIANSEIKHIKDAYTAGQRNQYSSADEYMKHEYNDFTA